MEFPQIVRMPLQGIVFQPESKLQLNRQTFVEIFHNMSYANLSFENCHGTSIPKAHYSNVSQTHVALRTPAFADVLTDPSPAKCKVIP
jgi:hypothetical protein